MKQLKQLKAGLLLTVLIGCGVPPPNAGLLARRATSLAEDLDCSSYQVDDETEEGHFRHLGCTGLYSNWTERAIAENVRPFTPAHAFWSDGAEKMRWIYLPPGERIDSGGDGYLGTMDGWIFPIGTRVWKQFSFGPRLVETRMLWKRRGGWFQTSYIWSTDQSSALESPTSTGLFVEGRDPDGPRYEIPSPRLCDRCHGGAADELLGFEAINLSAPPASGLTLDELVKQGLLTQNPDRPYSIPGDADASEALGWLHSNCGISCHNRRAMPDLLVPYMRLQISDLLSVEETETWRTAVAQRAQYYPLPSPCRDISTWARIAPGDPDCSAIPYRAGVRDRIGTGLINQMPPLLSHRPPAQGLEAVRRWISGL